MELGTLQKSSVFLLFIIAVYYYHMGTGLRVSPHTGRTQPSLGGGFGSIAPPFLRLIKAQPCLQVTQVMNPPQGACWL